jgi:diguanylate cyclase (GGDEF)-like protein
VPNKPVSTQTPLIGQLRLAPLVRWRWRRTPRLLAVVYLVSLILVSLTALAMTSVVGGSIASTAINSSMESDRALVTAFVDTDMRPEEMGAALTPGRRAELQQVIQSLTMSGIVRIKMYAPDGTIQLANDPALVGQNFGIREDLKEAFQGTANGDVQSDPSQEPDLTELGIPVLLEEYLPVQVDGNVVSVFEVYRDAAPILAQVGAARDQVLVVTLSAAGVLAILLYFVFRSADERLLRQTQELMDATRQDALTGMLNHGAVVDELARQLDMVVPEDQRVGIALIDVDNFKLLNDNHGHPAGDEVLQQVVQILRSEVSLQTVIGRYGPDEFLCVAPPACAPDLAPAVERLRERLKDLEPCFGGSERLPVTVSVGICYFPAHGRATTELLSVAALALREAKVGGGNQVKVAEATATEEAQTERTSFDILSSLVIAVDTKDHYTQQHSEDVARYAVFLADRLGLPPEWRRTLHIAGMLHDIGKIGIPDSIVRKPAPLTADEYQIVKQHVALGHMIVRDLPYLDLVRAGIRFHHEQWDGGGYLEGLDGEEIPYVARILAVADAFSAMTTSRTYRKAMPLREALHRLEDAAGSQLDPSLVGPFVQGMETAPDAPIPGADRRPLPLVRLPDLPDGGETTMPSGHAPSRGSAERGVRGRLVLPGRGPVAAIVTSEAAAAGDHPTGGVPTWLSTNAPWAATRQ